MKVSQRHAPRDLLSLLSYSSKEDHQPRDGPVHSQPKHHPSPVYQENALLTYPQTNLVRTFSQLRMALDSRSHEADTK